MTKTRTLDSAPSSIPQFLRAGVGALPGTGHLPFLAGGGGDLPDLELALESVAVEPARLAEYCEVCEFTLRDALPVTYPHVLAFPLHMALLTDSSFPFPAIGMVHVANRIVQSRPIGIGEELSLRVRAEDLQPHPKGTTFTLVSEARASGELVWVGESVNLRRGGGSAEGGPKPEPAKPAELSEEAEWKLPGDLGRSYGGVSGDRNPIHLYGLTAKAFGFPRQIAHGMWTKARCLAALQGRLPDAYTVDVAFKKPIPLPSTVGFGSRLGDGVIDFGVSRAKDGAPHLVGRVTGR
ncbi:MAG: hypothetical protein M3383_04525 [Actinomycetota bacterium]|nr:hypothetical protein [Actinomycetota bacterium]